MNVKLTILLVPALLLVSEYVFGQSGSIKGTINSQGEPVGFASISLDTEPIIGAQSDEKGNFLISDVPFGKYIVSVSYIGMEKQQHDVVLNAVNPEVELDINLLSAFMPTNDIVITGTKTFKRQTDSPVIVGIITSEIMDKVQACNLAEGLKFQPGLRVETDCQTCNYTQLRMNGLSGGYSQILINGRPIFSPLTGLYGLEQLPTNMIERIEVVRGGGSSLYGSSAIGGTVNVITKIPKKNYYELNSFYQSINAKSQDFVINGNTAIVQKNGKSGISFFFTKRQRDMYDHNDDNFSELPKLENTSIGTNIFYLPTPNQKLEISLSNLNEYRYGGEMVEKPAYLTLQSEERSHNVWMGSADYHINFNEDKSSLITYVAWQNTKRDHYTGIFPDDSISIQNHIENPPYGYSNTSTYQGGLQWNHKFMNFLNGTNTFTLGSEYIYDDVYDEISAYNYLVDQTTRNLGVFVQSDWTILPSLNLLSGLRVDMHNLVDKLVFNPRVSLLYKYRQNTQLRLNYGTGFRAPQAFDTDLHIAFAGGGISRVILSPSLEPETSKSFSASINYDKPTENFIAGFTLEGFYTRLENAFYLDPIGLDEFGEMFEKKNGQGATVKGITAELRANYNRIIQMESGLTIQSSLYDDPITYIEGIEGQRTFTRTPSHYGFMTLSANVFKNVDVDINYIYTGSMTVPHFASNENLAEDEIYQSAPFSELSTKVSYTLPWEEKYTSVEFFGGIKNILNAYQNDFDRGKDRDSNYIYGPSLPRTFYFGIKLSSL